MYDASLTWACVMQDDPGHNLICLRGFGLDVSLRAQRPTGHRHAMSLLGESSGPVWEGDEGRERETCKEKQGKEKRGLEEVRAANGTERNRCLCKLCIGSGGTTTGKRSTLWVS